MRRKVFTIEDYFQITGRGLVIVGKKEDRSFYLWNDASIIIVAPDGEEFQAKVLGIEMFSPPNFKIEAVSIGSFKNLELLKGSTVFVDE